MPKKRTAREFPQASLGKTAQIVGGKLGNDIINALASGLKHVFITQPQIIGETIAYHTDPLVREQVNASEANARNILPHATSVTPLQNVAKTGQAALEVATFGAGGSAASQVGKVGIKALAKRGAIQGLGYGAGFGATGALQEDKPTVGSVLKSTALGAGIGSLAGAVAEPLVGKASQILSKRSKEAVDPLGAAVAKKVRPRASGSAKRAVEGASPKAEGLSGEVIDRSVLTTSQDAAREASPKLAKATGSLVEQDFNTAKLNLPKTQIKKVDKIFDALGLQARKVRTFEDVKRGAAELGADPMRFLRQVQTGRITDSEVVALKDLINTNSRFIVKSQKQLKLRPDLEDSLAPKIAQAEAQMQVAVGKLVKGGTEAGRAVASYRILANKTLEPTFWLERAARELNGRPLTSDIVDAVHSLAQSRDRIGLAQLVAGLREMTPMEKGVTIWKANLLTNPTTDVANIGGSGTMGVLENISNMPRAALDAAASLVTGKRTFVPSVSNLPKQLKAFSGAVKDSWQYMKTGVDPVEMLSKWDIPYQSNIKTIFGSTKLGRVADVYQKAIFRRLGAEDKPFYRASFIRELDGLIGATVRNEGLTGTRAAARARYLLDHPTPEMDALANAYAAYSTYKNQNVMASAISRAKQGVKKVKGGQAAYGAMELVAPFSTTPTNVAQVIFDYTPAKALTSLIRLANPTTRSQYAFVQEMGRSLTGTGAIAMGYWLASKGLATGDLPKDTNQKNLQYIQNKPSFAVKFGGRWRKLDRFSPGGNLLTLGATLYQFRKQGKTGLDLAISSSFAALKGLTEQTFLKGLSGGLKAINEPDRYAPAFMEQTAAGLIPAILGKTAKVIDPVQRDATNAVEAVANRIPWLSKRQQPVVGALGDVNTTEGGALQYVDPFTSKTERADPVLSMLKDAGVGPAQYNGKALEQLAPADKTALLNLIGQERRSLLSQIAANPSFFDLPKDQQAQLLERAIGRATDIAINKFQQR